MKPALILLLFLSSAAMLRGQIINGDFENWTNGKPDGWETEYGISRDIDSHSGSYSLLYNQQGTTKGYYFLDNNRGFKMPSGKYQISMWYKFRIEGDYPEHHPYDYVNLGIAVQIFRHETTTFSISTEIDTVSIWKKNIGAELPFTDSLQDSIYITFYHAGEDHYPKVVFFNIDALILESFQESVDHSQSINNILFSISPNPITSHAHLKLHLDGTASIRAAIYDVTGREVLRLPELTAASGDESIPFDVDEIPNGMYYVRCEVGGNVMMEKIIVQH